MAERSHSTGHASSSTDGEGDDDPVLYECDLILSQPTHNSSLYLLQYPLRSLSAPVGTERKISGARVRPKHARVELSVDLLPTIRLGSGEQKCSASFDDDAPAAAPARAIGNAQILRSQAACGGAANRPHANYAAAKLTKGAFVLAPVRAIAQLRPAFDHIDKAEVKAATTASRRRDSQNNIDDNADSNPTPLSVSFRKRESERAAAKRKSSHAAITKREAEEPWLDLNYEPAEQCAQKKNFLFRAARSRAFVKQEITPAPAAGTPDTPGDYLELFDAHTRTVALKRPANEPASQRSMLASSTVDAVKHLLAHSRICSFADCLRVTDDSVPADQVVGALVQVGVLLHGNWVAKAPVRTPKGRKLAERFEAARCLILDLLRKNIQIDKRTAMEVVKNTLDEERVSAVLDEVATRSTLPGIWRLKRDEDTLFLDTFPNVVRDQNVEWDKRLLLSRKLLGQNRRREKSEPAIRSA